MTNLILHKALKRNKLGHLMLCGLVSLSSTVQAAASTTQTELKESYDYTLQNHLDQEKPIEEEAYLDIEEMPRDLDIILKAASKDHNDLPQLLAMAVQDMQNSRYYKYLFASNGLLTGKLAQQTAHNLHYHLVKAPKGPVIWQVLSFLDQKSDLTVKALKISKDRPLCLPCRHMCMHLFDQKLPVHKKGCQEEPFPTTSAPTSAIACFYSDRFTDDQRRLVISQVGEKAFSPPKKPITPLPTHTHHQSTSQLLIPPLPPGQLLIPANGYCLYTTIIMGYLLPVREAADIVTERMQHLFGHQPALYLNELYQTLHNPPHHLLYLHSSNGFSVLINAFLSHMNLKKEIWGGPQQIQTIANKLKVNIQVHYPNPSNPMLLLPADLTKSDQANPTTTIHIVRDNVHPSEIFTQKEQASPKVRQHYRLRYTLSSPIPAPFSPNTKPSTPPVQMFGFSTEVIAYHLNLNTRHSSTIAPYTNNASNDQNKAPTIDVHQQSSPLRYKPPLLVQSIQPTVYLDSLIIDNSAPKIKALAAAKVTTPVVRLVDHMSTPTPSLKQTLFTDQLLIPANGHCLYTTIIMGYLLPVRHKVAQINARISQLFGNQPPDYLYELHQTLQDPIHALPLLHSDAFNSLVTTFMARMNIKEGTWGGPQEIQTIANKLTINIQLHYPDPSNPTNLIQAPLTKPAQENAKSTLHIVQDKVHPAEVLTEDALPSAEDNPHYQHYRLKYTLSPSSPVSTSYNLQSPRFHNIASPRKKSIKPYLVEWFEAAKTGNKQWLKKLYKHHNINVNAKNEENYTPLLLSAYYGHLDCLQWLCQQGADTHHKNDYDETALLWSAGWGHVDCVRYLLQQGADIHASDKDGYTALFFGAGSGHLDCVKCLVQQGAPLNAQSKLGTTALILSAQKGRLDCLKYLVAQGADITCKDSQGDTALLWSTQNGYLQCVKYLVQQGVNINARNKHRDTALLLSAYGGNLACLKYLVKKGANIYAKNKKQFTALHWSARNGHLACVKYLVKKDADIHDKDDRGVTPLLWSAHKGHLNCLKYLVEKGADINACDKDSSTALLLSAEKGHLRCIKYLCKQGANVNIKHREGHTPLLWATQYGHTACLRHLIQQGANVHARDKWTITPLLKSAQEGHLDCLKYLLKKGADIATRDTCDYTALLWSAQEGHLSCLRYLLQKGADICARDKWNNTALIRSAQEGHLGCVKYCVKYLLRKGKKGEIDASDEWGKTALIWSTQNGHVDCLNYLIINGAKLCSRDNDRYTALLWSAINGHLDCLQLLIKEGANINTRNQYGDTALVLSAYKGHLAIVKYLVKQRANIKLKGEGHKTALQWAKQQGQTEVIRYLSNLIYKVSSRHAK